jgi:hypothetical protein
VLTAKNMIDFYTVLLDDNELDPVIDSFLNSGLLYNSFASVSQETALSEILCIPARYRPDHAGGQARLSWLSNANAL